MNSKTQAVYDALAANHGKTFRASANFDSNKDQLVTDLKLVMADAEKLIKEAAGASNESFALLRERLDVKLVEAKARLKSARSVIAQQAQQATAVAHTYVKANPWQTAGLAIAAGVVLGFCLGQQAAADYADAPAE
jgi:ElaB/YqjD/DUF883 family membrane-anchored ribosome-binding protein